MNARLLVLRTQSSAMWGFEGFAPKQGFHPFTPFKTYFLLY
ncbi:hypothetical protein [Oscillatoria sp. FACHB-1407]|nr:hypothetical protein [Oscillatoria sp. FACHB-1407]